MTNVTAVACPHCDSEFEPRRRNQKFCTEPCRKAAYQLRDRVKNPKNSLNSREVRRANAERIEYLMNLTMELYATKPDERLGFLKGLVDRARDGEKALRDALTNRFFLGAKFINQPWLYLRRSWAYPNVAKATNKYCRKYWNAGVIDVVLGNVPEPQTGEVDLAFGAEIGDLKALQNVVSIVVKDDQKDAPIWTTKRNPGGSAEYVPMSLTDLKRLLRGIPEYQNSLSEFEDSLAA